MMEASDDMQLVLLDVRETNEIEFFGAFQVPQDMKNKLEVMEIPLHDLQYGVDFN